MYETQPALYAAGLRIPGRLIYAIKFLRGEDAGMMWLEELDAVLGVYQHRWNLRYEAIAEGGAMSCCAYCLDDSSSDLVLKVPVDAASGVTEARTLTIWQQSGVVPKVLESDPVTGVFLMQRLRPGVTYTGVRILDDSSTFIDMFRHLQDAGKAADWTDVPPLSTLIRDRLSWAEERFAQADAAPVRPDLDRAAAIASSLEGLGPQQVVHGDLQAKNLIWGGDRRLYCIDPFTAYGDPSSDAAMWAVLQDSDVPIQPLLGRLARELNIDQERLEDWAYVISTAELRPSALDRFIRQRAFLQTYTSARA